MDIRKLAVAIALPLLVGFAGATFTDTGEWYASLSKPSFNPPNWLFAPVWTLLYVLMGISLYLAWVNHFGKEKYAPHLFAAQLFLNFLWSFLFFGLHAPLLALLDILLLWVAIAATILAFHKISSSAAYLLTPYLLWVSFAVILNASIVYLN